MKYEEIKEKGDLVAMITDGQRLESIWFYRKKVYSIIYDLRNNEILEIKELGGGKK